MNVASLELCKELYKMSGWDGTHYVWYNRKLILERLVKYDKGTKFPAYDLGYLLRKIGESSRHDHEDFGMFDTVGVFHVGSTENKYLASCASDGEQIDALYERANTPEDAAAKLAIELFKQGILK